MSARVKVILLFAVCAAPFVLGWLAYAFEWGTGGAPANYGELIAPQPLAGEPFVELRGKWVLVTVDAAACDASCERKLYVIRQVRRAQGQNMERVERLWLLSDGAMPRSELVTALQGMRIVRANAQQIAAFPGNAAEHVYVIDPLGNLMMRFPPNADPSRVLKDLQRLLKVSRFG